MYNYTYITYYIYIITYTYSHIYMYTHIYTLCLSLHIHGLMGSIHNFFFFGCKLLFSTGIVDVSCHTVSVVVLCFCNMYAMISKEHPKDWGMVINHLRLYTTHGNIGGGLSVASSIVA